MVDMDNNSLLSEKEMERLTLSFGSTRGDRGFTEEELVSIIRWAEQAVLSRALFENVMDGHVDVDVDENGEVLFAISNKGIDFVNKNVLQPQSDTIQ